VSRKAVRRVLLVLLGMVFLGSSALLTSRLVQYQEGEEAYAEAEELVELPDLTEIATEPVQEPEPVAPKTPETPPETEEPVQQEQQPVYVDPYADALKNMDFAALREVNSDVLGWILIPWTKVSYPLVQTEDNDYYLNHTWRKSRSAVGSIYLECRNSSDLSDFNTIIYGHRMKNGSMFASLKYYGQQSYWQEHPKIYIMDDNGMHTYEIFSAYEAGVTQDTYRLKFENETEKQNFIDFCVSQSVIETGVVPATTDRILTLSTCTGNGYDTRWVVQGVLRTPVDTAEKTDSAPAAEAALPA